MSELGLAGPPRRKAGWSRVAGGVCGLAVAAGAVLVIARVVDPPPRLARTEFDGRTWLSLSGGTGGTRVVLANGISGLVEAQATIAATSLPTGLGFSGSDAHATLLEGDGAAVVVADGSHAGTVVPTDEGARSALGAPGIVTAGAALWVRSVGVDGSVGRATEVLGVDPVSGVAPVVDAAGATWVLVGRRADSVVRIDADGRVGRTIEVEPGATGLAVVDGDPYLERSGSVVALLDGIEHPAPAGFADVVVPSVAEATDGRWATASGRLLTLDESAPLALDAEVTALAVWHGEVWAVVGGDVGAVRNRAIDAVHTAAGPVDVFSDGGRLWFVSGSEAVAVDRTQQATVFRLSSVDLDVCVDDCSPDDAIEFGAASADPARTPTAPLDPVAITLPAHVPTTSTTAPPATTVPAPTTPPPTVPVTAARAPVTATTSAPPSTLPTPGTSTTVATTVTTAAVPEPLEPAPTRPPERPGPAPTPPPDPPTVPLPPPTEPPPPPTEPATTEPATTEPATTEPATTEPATTEPATTEPATTEPLPIGLVLGFADGGGPTTATSVDVMYGVTGDPVACGVEPGGSTIAALTITTGGSTTSATPQVGFGDQQSMSIVVQPGALTVSLAACGQTSRIDRLVEAADPELTGITVDPPTVDAGQPFTATVGYRYGGSWAVTGATWSGGPCGAEAALDGSFDSGSSSVSVPTAGAGRYCVSVIVSFLAGDGSVRDAGAGAQLDVLSPTTTSTTTTPPTTTTTTTTTPPTTTTTTPPTTTTTITSPTTTTTTSTTTTSTSTTSTPTTTSTTSTTTSTVPGVSTTTSTVP